MISFIIPAHNEEALIGATIAALQTATEAVREPFEIIVADDASTDRTAEVARAHGATVVAAHRRQVAAARNAGARQAIGDVLVFVDADTIVPEATLRGALTSIRAGAVGGGSEVRFEGPIPWAVWLYIVGFMAVWRRLRLAAGCFLFATRSAFDAAGGWDEQYFAGEEMYLSRALKQQGRFVMLQDPVISSGRKARLYSAMELMGLCVRLLWRGPSAWRRREGLGMWYDGRREYATSGADGESAASPRPGAGTKPQAANESIV